MMVTELQSTDRLVVSADNGRLLRRQESVGARGSFRYAVVWGVSRAPVYIHLLYLVSGLTIQLSFLSGWSSTDCCKESQ